MSDKNTVSLQEAIEQMVKQYKLSPGLYESRIREKWATVMGTMIAKHTSGIQLRKGKLYLKVDSAPLKNELTYSKEKIKEIFNKELEGDIITDVLIF